VLESENKTCAEIYNNVTKCKLSGDIQGGMNVETREISDINDSFCFSTLIEHCRSQFAWVSNEIKGTH